jgi:hypothetical protein
VDELYFTKRKSLDFPKALKNLEEYLTNELGEKYFVDRVIVAHDKFHSIGVTKADTEVAIISLYGEAAITPAEINLIEGLLIKWATKWHLRNNIKYHFDILVLKQNERLRRPFTMVQNNPAGP